MANGYGFDEHFSQFGQSLRQLIKPMLKMSDADRLQRQQQQLESLWAMEKEFRQLLIAHRWGPGAYQAFVDFIVNDKKNILAARPYFRERQATFASSISHALRQQDIQTLYQFHVNYNFVVHILGLRPWGGRGGSRRLVQLGNDMGKLRQQLVEENLPLVINRARLFYSHTPRSHLSLMDLVQTSVDGLLSSIDKFCPPFSRMFRGVAIGRIVGNLIESYSSTSLHFFPADKRKIYRANKLLRHQPATGVDYEDLARRVNIDLNDPGHETTASELTQLLAAASTVSSNTPVTGAPDDGYFDAPKTMEEQFVADDDTRPDTQVEAAELRLALARALEQLPRLETKVLRFRGIDCGGLL